MGKDMEDNPRVSAPACDVGSPFQVKRAGLCEIERRAYDAVLLGLSKMDETIALPSGLEKTRVSWLYRCVHDDNPLLFCCDNSFGIKRQSSRLLLVPHYRMEKREYEQELSEVRQTSETIAVLAAGFASDIEKAKAIHDWFLTNCRYGKTELRNSHEVTGPLLDGIAVCEGISRAFKHLCDLVGVPSRFVSGTIDSGEDGEGAPARHAWNIVSLPLRSGSFRSFHIDVTHDLNLSSTLHRYDYFCLSDDEISADHAFDDRDQPPCSSPFGYYRAVGLYAESKSEMDRLITKAVAGGDQALVVQMPKMTDVPPDEARAAFSKSALKAYSGARREGLGLMASLEPIEITQKFNPARMVFEVSFG